MARGHWHPTRCYTCGTTREEAGRISQTGKCEACGRIALNQAHEELREHRGDTFARWRKGMAASVGAVLPELAPSSSTDAG